MTKPAHTSDMQALVDVLESRAHPLPHPVQPDGRVYLRRRSDLPEPTRPFNPAPGTIERFKRPGRIPAAVRLVLAVVFAVIGIVAGLHAIFSPGLQQAAELVAERFGGPR